VAVKHNAGESVLRAFNNTGDFENGTCGYSVSCSELMGGCKGNSSRAVLALTRHQRSIHCESSRVANGTNKRKQGYKSPYINKTELNSRIHKAGWALVLE